LSDVRCLSENILYICSFKHTLTHPTCLPSSLHNAPNTDHALFPASSQQNTKEKLQVQYPSSSSQQNTKEKLQVQYSSFSGQQNTKEKLQVQYPSSSSQQKTIEKLQVQYPSS
jgi:hypothetical protein